MSQKAPDSIKELSMRLAGDGGEGVVSLGEILTNKLASMGWEVMNFKNFPPEIRGGPAFFDLRISGRPVLTIGDSPDILLAMNREALTRHARSVAAGGIILADSELSGTADAPEMKIPGVEIIYLPFTRIARDDLSFLQGKNMVCLGALSRLCNLSDRKLIHYLKVRFGVKGASVVEKNINCFRMGFKTMADNIKKDEKLRISARSVKRKRYLINGNEAVALGAMKAGCTYFAGYPITPATGIMEFLSDKLPCLGGYVLQMEDEIAALASVLGASFAGKLSMTATSGPGLSLMSEIIGLASMSEIPAVIVDVQRSGPSTGMPTKTEQSDLSMAIGGIHGEGPKAVLAASDVADCFHMTIEAFRFAEKYQIPVILLTDQHLAYTTSSVEIASLKQELVPPRCRPAGDYELFERYTVTDDGISPMPAAGDPGFRYVASGLEHDTGGRPNFQPENREEMVSKRARKVASLAGENGGSIVSDNGRESGIISWGSTYGAIVESIDMASREGLDLDHIHLKRLHPLPLKDLVKFARGKKNLIAIELNNTGQLAFAVQGALCRPIKMITATRGTPFKPGELLAMIKEVRD